MTGRAYAPAWLTVTAVAGTGTGMTGSVAGERITTSMDSSVRKVAEHLMLMD